MLRKTNKIINIIPKYKLLDNKLFILNGQKNRYIYVKQKLPDFIHCTDELLEYDVNYKKHIYPKCIHLHEPPHNLT